MAERSSRVDGLVPRILALLVFAGCALAIFTSWQDSEDARPSLFPTKVQPATVEAPPVASGEPNCQERVRLNMVERLGSGDFSAEQRMMLRQEIARQCG